jgi:hypothetical protein
MPRLSLYHPEKGNNYRFIDRQVSRMFQVGCTDVHLHKYLGPKIQEEGTADQPIYQTVSEINIQDLLFLENRDRKYEPEVYCIRGHYQIQNLDFNLSQFGLFIDNDTVFMTVHINDFIESIGRKPLDGDVIELPHLRDDFSLNDYDVSVPRFFVIEDVTRASEGYSATWYPHLYRLKLKKIADSQQYDDILNQPASEDSSYALRDLLSTRKRELEINDAIVGQAESDAPLCGYETRQYYTLALDPATGKTNLMTVDSDEYSANYQSQIVNGESNVNASSLNAVPLRTGYTGYLVGDGYPYNGYVFGQGIEFPTNVAKDDFFLRLDFVPNRLFRYDGRRWHKVEDAIRTTLTNTDTRLTRRLSFINNSKFTYNDEIASDYVRIPMDTTVIYTAIDFSITAPYIVLKFETNRLEFVVDDFENMLQSYDVEGEAKIKINLPIVNDVQVKIPYTGAWRVCFYTYRESERQGISKVLKPRADF